MAYVEPKHWEHEDLVTAADINVYSENLRAFRDTLEYQSHMASNVGMSDARTFVHKHTYRWLVYRSRASGDSPLIWLMGSKDDEDDRFSTSLDGGEEQNVLDLTSIGWLVDGMTYIIDDVRYAYEQD